MTRQAASVDHAERVRLFREVQRVFSEHLPALYFAAPRGSSGGRPARPQRDAGADLRPQLLWSADTLAVTRRRARALTA